jgi:ATP-dependent Lon protease
VILCSENRIDVDDIKQDYLKGLKFHYVSQMDEVLKLAI